MQLTNKLNIANGNPARHYCSKRNIACVTDAHDASFFEQNNIYADAHLRKARLWMESSLKYFVMFLREP